MTYDEFRQRILVLQKYAGAFVLADQILRNDLKVSTGNVVLILNTTISPDVIELNVDGGCLISLRVIDKGEGEGIRIFVDAEGVLTDMPCSQAMEELIGLGVLGIVERQAVHRMFDYLKKSI